MLIKSPPLTPPAPAVHLSLWVQRNCPVVPETHGPRFTVTAAAGIMQKTCLLTASQLHSQKPFSDAFVTVSLYCHTLYCHTSCPGGMWCSHDSEPLRPHHRAFLSLPKPAVLQPDPSSSLSLVHLRTETSSTHCCQERPSATVGSPEALWQPEAGKHVSLAFLPPS